jgi:hypothetical protein
MIGLITRVSSLIRLGKRSGARRSEPFVEIPRCRFAAAEQSRPALLKLAICERHRLTRDADQYAGAAMRDWGETLSTRGKPRRSSQVVFMRKSPLTKAGDAVARSFVQRPRNLFGRRRYSFAILSTSTRCGAGFDRM